MKTVFSLIFSLLFCLETPQIITLKDYYYGKGAIFNKNYKYPFIKPDYRNGVTPTIKQITQAETLFYSHYYEYRKSVLDSFKSNYRLNTKLKNSQNVKKRFRKYYRQYAGYVNTSNDTIIYIGLLNFANTKKAALYFEDWDTILFLGCGEYYQINQEHYSINLTKKKILFN